MLGFITVAASDSAEELKAQADVVCTGKNDELTLQKVIDEAAGSGKNIYLLNGIYRIDAFHDFGDGGAKSALCFPNCVREIRFIGQNFAWGKGRNNGARLYVSGEALDSIDGETDVIRTTWTKKGMSSGSLLYMENITVSLSHNQKAIRAIDLRRCDRPELKCVCMNAYTDMEAGFGNPPAVPAEGCIGLTMTDGSNTWFSSFTQVGASGFYEGIQVGGEHVVMTNCMAIMNFYGYTFGNYPLNNGANHPITMINCMDERNVNLPLFNSCGDADGKGGRIQGGQEVTMISFNLEYIESQTPGKKHGDLMREVYPGTWCGNIDFTLQPAWCHTNSVDQGIWENDGSGSRFKTRNNNHKEMCTTEERLSYYPSLGQQIFDTDLGKLVICTNPEKKTWVDANGNEV